MAGQKKRAFDAKQQRPSKKQKRQQQYHSDSEGDNDNDNDEQSFNAVNLLDSDDDVHNVTVDQDDSDHDTSSSEDERPALTSSKTKAKKRESKSARAASKPAAVLNEEEDDEDEDGDGNDDDDEEEEEEESDVDEYDLDSENGHGKKKSKRNDPSAFATSISKILSTKLSTSKRADPVLSRSAAAHEASKAAVDGALEAKARRHMKEQKRKALEKGRIRDVLVASRDDELNAAGAAGESTTSQILETERRLRKVAQRGVVKLFNAVRAAQVKAVEAEKETRREGVIGMNHRAEKVNELSKKGFLDLIASGGGGLKKGGLEEA
ncbi:hypothetical protein E4U43_002109 [Claviceps pusilla]|uniref:RRP15 Essential protein involved in pre-rRNA processing n=1 Tax=Claviceps pusilla TaxID=123648 RepID=A0A9P7N7A3_9HYPO|nr:hypothetical protein E4U43_002109 [Claviceps pusilla]